MNEKIKYITGTFLVQANEAFLNGGGSTFGEDENIVMPKFMWVNGQKVPYVSSQAWKHWLRDTLIRETNWPKSELRAIGWNAQGNTSKVAGMLNPIDYPEDDIFGYMFASGKEAPKNPDEEKTKILESLPKKQLVRPATFLASLLSAIQPKGTISTDEAFIHLKGESTPLPYTTNFYNADLSAIFGIDVTRIGVYDNFNAEELNPELVDPALAEKKIEIVEAGSSKDKKGIYSKVDRKNYAQLCVEQLLNALARLQGGAKLAQFGVDISPKAIVCAGIDFKGPIFNNLFKVGNEKPILNIELLKELIKDYEDRIHTPIYIGVRTGYLENEEELRSIKEHNGIQIKIITPLEIKEIVGE